MDKETQNAFKLLGQQINTMHQDINGRLDNIQADIETLSKTVITHYKVITQHGIAIKELQKC